MRRMSEEEQPLMMCLSWADTGAENLDYNKFVLQENDCGEIMVGGEGDYDGDCDDVGGGNDRDVGHCRLQDVVMSEKLLGSN